MTVAHPVLAVWFTGLSGFGKSTLSLAVNGRLTASGYRVQLLDGDEVRLFLSKGWDSATKIGTKTSVELVMSQNY